MKKRIPLIFAALVAGSTLLSAGCATTGAALCRPEPLSHPEIRYDDAANDFAIDEHIYFSKEASRGGRGLGGGGCGCN